MNHLVQPFHQLKIKKKKKNKNKRRKKKKKLTIIMKGKELKYMT
jgi:hypothetical protein